MRLQRRFPDHFYNPISLFGAGVAMFAVAAIIILYVLSVVEGEANPYLGIFILILFPALLGVGVLLIPLGMRRARKRRQQPPVIDLSDPRHRNLALVFLACVSLFLLLSTVGLYETFHFTESNQFCGAMCHEPMTPEYQAWASSPHAQVECVSCHVGPGNDWFLKAKLNGARQLWHQVRGDYNRPIPTPVEFLRPARDICEQCHWPDQFYTWNEVVRDHYLGDESNTHWQLRLLMAVGGTSRSRAGKAEGIHWHVDPDESMTYVASDHTRESFDQLTWNAGGKHVTYTRDGAPLSAEELRVARAEGRERELDCMDCHNRPAHHFDAPAEAVNLELTTGRLDDGIPWIKREAVRALSTEYQSREDAHAGIRQALSERYAEIDADLPRDAVDTIIGLYDRHMFPTMKARWDRYPDHVGHMFTPGCFRCHGSDLRTAEGRTISADCKLCHVLVSQGIAATDGGYQWTTVDGPRITGLDFRHPIDIDGAEEILGCWECHVGDGSVYLD